MLTKELAVPTKLGRDWSFVVMRGSNVLLNTKNKRLAESFFALERSRNRTNLGLYKRNNLDMRFVK